MKFQLLWLFSIIFILLNACSSDTQENENTEAEVVEPPNILFIMTDDHAFQAISAYGSILIETPNIDRLAKEGMRFDKAFVSNSICSPSRAVVLTGKFSHLNSVRDNLDVFDSTQITLPKILKQHGYQTAIVGKWHLKSLPTGFDYWRILPDQGDYYQPEFITPNGTVTKQGYVTDITTDMAIGYLDSIRNKDKPFLLMYQHKAPHREWNPSMENLQAFHSLNIPEPATLFDDYKTRGKASKEAEMRINTHMGLTNDNKVPPEVAHQLQPSFLDWYDGAYTSQQARMTTEEKQKWDAVYQPIINKLAKDKPQGNTLTSWKYKRYMQDYLACIKSVDDNIGRVLKYLEENNLLDNTVIIYTSDQGFYLGEHGWFDKRFMYEESFRTPLIIRWKDKIKPNQVNTDLVQNIDFAPTMLEMAGIPIPEDMQGESLVPLFKGQNENWREALYYHYYEFPGIHSVKRHYGIRTDRYKLIHFYYDIDEWELYDLKKDPEEMVNVYNSSDYSQIRLELKQKLKQLRKQYKDSKKQDKKWIKYDLERLEKLEKTAQHH